MIRQHVPAVLACLAALAAPAGAQGPQGQSGTRVAPRARYFGLAELAGGGGGRPIEAWSIT